MYRYLFRTVCTARQRAIHVHETCVLLTKCDTAALLGSRVGRGIGANPLSTSLTGYCKKNDSVSTPKLDNKGDACKDNDPMETRTGFEMVNASETKAMETQEQDEGTPLKTDGGSNLLRDDAETGHKLEKQQKAKTGKEGLLDLLGTMKVQVINKKRIKGLKSQQSHQPTTMNKPAAMESTFSMFQKATNEASIHSETLTPDLVAAASAAASSLPNPSQAESELLKQLRKHEAVAEDQKKGDMKNIGTIIANMKVGKRPTRQHAGPANQIQFDEDGRGYKPERGMNAEDGVWRRKNLFEGKRLGIFSPVDNRDADSAIAGPTLWDIGFADQLIVSTNQMPRNGYEEMIHWTREGRLWQYPINNEAGMEEEAAIPFHEHIFLEVHLEEGFPRQGPVRHFMELVVAGLAKNPHLTVRQKKEHIAWFRDYFQQKETEVFFNQPAAL